MDIGLVRGVLHCFECERRITVWWVRGQKFVKGDPEVPDDYYVCIPCERKG